MPLSWLTILLRWYTCAPGLEQVLGAVWIEWWQYGAARRLPATGLQTRLAGLGHAMQERRGIPHFMASSSYKALQALCLVPKSLVAIALHEMPQLRQGRTCLQAVEPA